MNDITKKNMAPVGIVVAMDKEFRQLVGLLEGKKEECFSGKTFVCGCIGGLPVVLMQCGIGKVNAAVGAVELINHYAPRLVVSSGVAGGAQPDMQPLDVVLGTHYTYHDVYCGSEVAYGQFVGMPNGFDTPADVVEGAVRAASKIEGVRLRTGLIVTGDWFVDSRDKMRSILELFPEAVAVDMESCSIAQTCYLYGVPFLSLRLISDVPLSDHKAAQYFDFWDRMANGSFQVVKNILEGIEV